MVKVDFYHMDQIKDEDFQFAVIMSRYEGKWVFCKHKDRTTYEIPGGHRKENELIADTARRELYEETGAMEFNIAPVCSYSVEADFIKTFGMVYLAEITVFGKLPDLEIERIELFNDMPANLTYPLIQPDLFAKVLDSLCECEAIS